MIINRDRNNESCSNRNSDPDSSSRAAAIMRNSDRSKITAAVMTAHVTE